MAHAEHPHPQIDELPPLRSREAYERALAEASAFLQAEPPPGSAAEARFHAILRQIAEFRPYGDPAPAALGSELERRLRHAARGAGSGSTEHWKPMIGGDLRSGPETRS